jgi:mono/diheme cytochrome c family protein
MALHGSERTVSPVRLRPGASLTVEHTMPVVRILAAVGVVVAIGGPAAAQDAKIERGKALVTAQKCTICHEIEGQGNKKGPLAGVGSKLTGDEIRQWLVSPKEMAEKAKAQRKPPMKSFANLPKDDIDALVAYVQTLKR